MHPFDDLTEIHPNPFTFAMSSKNSLHLRKQPAEVKRENQMDKIMVKSVDVDCRIQVTVINKDDSLHIFTHTFLYLYCSTIFKIQKVSPAFCILYSDKMYQPTLM